MARPTLAHRSPQISTPPVLTRPIPFYPAKLSDAELEFLLDHMEDPPTVALQGELPKGVNPRAIEHVLEPMFQLEQLRVHRGRAWAGFDQVRDVIVRYREWHKLSLDSQAMGGPRHPGQYHWDSAGVMTKGVPGTDSAEMVRTEILEDGSRRDLYLPDLRRPVQSKQGPNLPWLRKSRAEADARANTLDVVQHDDSKGLMTCTICGHVVTYRTGAGRTAINMARGQMARHLKSTRKEPTRHRELYRREFR